jgi:hypothetical protein
MIKLLLPLLILMSCGKPINNKDVEDKKKISPIMPGVSENMFFDMKMSMNFNLLPLKGKIGNPGLLWSGDIWKLSRGAINFRWNAVEKSGFNYQSPTSREILAYPKDKMRELSPAEKYDIYAGRYDYPLKNEVDWVARQGKMEWEGLCHGWAGASLNHVEPEPVTVTNPDGILVEFGSSDIKALLTFAYSKMSITPEQSLGKRCEYYSLLDDEDYCDDDLSAMTFHIVLTNKVGLRGQSFIADMDRYKEVWNHPVLSYESKIVSRTNSKIVLTTKISYVDVMEKNAWEKGMKQMISYMTMTYELKLDGSGNIIDSKWISRERPDFLWTVSRPEEFDGYLSLLKNLVK